VSDRTELRTFDRIAPIISDLGQSLYMLFGRNWETELKAKWRQLKGSFPPSSWNTPTPIQLIEKYLPEVVGWNLAQEQEDLYNDLKSFLTDVYDNLVKHLEEELLPDALRITYDDLKGYMETVRRTWVWFIEKHEGLRFDKELPAFADFLRRFA
jgi:hypothetical protein